MQRVSDRGRHTAECRFLFWELPPRFSNGPRVSCLHCSSAKDMCSMGPRWHNQDLLSVVSEWGLWIIPRWLSPAYPKHACLLLQFLLHGIVARMDLCWAISHSSCVITIIVMRTQKQRLNALWLPKNVFVSPCCCDLWSTMWLGLLVATKMKTSWCLITRDPQRPERLLVVSNTLARICNAELPREEQFLEDSSQDTCPQKFRPK